MNRTRRILVVEDELVVAADIQQRLVALGYEVSSIASTGEEAVQLAVESKPDLVLMDIVLPGGMDGVAAANQIRQRLDIPVVFLTAHSDAHTFARAKMSDPFGYVVKPFEERTLQIAVELAPHRHELERKLRQISRWMTATLSSIGDAVMATNSRGEVLLLNLAAEHLTGWPQAEAAGQPIEALLRLVQEHTGEPLPNPVWSILRDGKARIQESALLVTRGGGQIHIDACAAPIIDENDTLLGVVLVFRDISDRLHAAERIQQLNEQVRRLTTEAGRQGPTSDEQHTLARAVSHDLRAPLRGIAGYARLLEKSYASQLDDAGRELLTTIQSSARSMNAMLEAYLAFLGVSGRGLEPSGPVNMEELVQSVFDELNVPHAGPPTTLIRQPLPSAWGDRSMLRQVMVNLLSNAIKFSVRRAAPTVEVGGVVESDRLVYFVKDNGVGFDSRHAGKLFEAFQRLHSADFPGTGLGLAIVKRIIERHGGKVWAENLSGQGAAFFFSLPPAPQAK